MSTESSVAAAAWVARSVGMTRCRGAVYVNGNDHAGSEQRSFPVYDHGFLYGEGVYETLRTYNRVPFLYDRHMRRLRASAERLRARCAVRRRDAGGVDRTTRIAAAGELRRGLHPRPADARRRRADLRLGATPAPSLVIIVKPLDEAAGAVDDDGITHLAGRRSCAITRDRSTRSSSRTTC